MKLVFLGTGYVGLVTGACLADLGHHVTCVDIDIRRVAALQRGQDVFFEPGLSRLVKRNVRARRLNFAAGVAGQLRGVRVIFIAVGTPQCDNGAANLDFVRSAARDIAKNLKGYAVIINKSTVPVGTAEIVRKIIRKYYRGRFDVASNPEFLREGSAIADFMKPDRVVVGVDSSQARQIMTQVYRPITAPKLFTSIPTAELIKYSANSFLAMKLSFINEIASLSELVGADVQEVAKGIGLDSRIGPKFLQAGFGFGGSCFPKDVNALNFLAHQRGFDFKLIKALLAVNERQKQWFFTKIKKYFHGKLSGKKIVVLGLAFKGNTDDVRESPALDLIVRLKHAGANIVAFDPEAMDNARAERPHLKTAGSVLAAVRGAEAIVLATEWDQFRKLPLKKIRALVKRRVIFDGRNLLDPAKAKKAGFQYFSIGRGTSV